MSDHEIMPVASTSGVVVTVAVDTIAIGRRKFDKKILKLASIVKPRSKTAVWEHFGIMQYNEITIAEVKDKFYCKHCFEKGQFKFYSNTTASGNLNDHLASEHKIVIKKAMVDHNQRKIDNMLSPETDTEIVPSKKDGQYLLNRHICLWLCRDLQPFHTVEKAGFSTLFAFLFKWLPFKVPSRATVSLTALNDIYSNLKTKLIDLLQQAPKHGAITFDGWTDKYKHRKYITFTYHFIDANWRTNAFVLQTAILREDSKSPQLKAECLKVIDEYNLQNKSIQLVTDCGTNMIATCKSLQQPHYACLAHKIYNLITRDFLVHSTMSPIKNLIDKLSRIQIALLYRHDELECIENENHQKAYSDFLLDCVDYGTY